MSDPLEGRQSSSEDEFLERAFSSSNLVNGPARKGEAKEGLRKLVIEESEEDEEEFGRYRLELQLPHSPISLEEEVATPRIMVTSPSTANSRRGSVQVTEGEANVETPEIEIQIESTPAGTVDQRCNVAQPLRRSESARPAPSSSRYRRHQQSNSVSPRPSQQHGDSKTTISRMSSVKAGRMGFMSKGSAGPLSPPMEGKGFSAISEALNENQCSFSEKERVKETLKLKSMSRLDTNITARDLKPRDLPATPTSMVDTPKEMYGSKDPFRRLSPAKPNDYSEKRRSLLSQSPTEQSPLPLTPDSQRREMFRRSSSAAVRRYSVSERCVYSPGPIRLEERFTFIPRRASVATMEPFDNGVEPRTKRFSDAVAMDGIIMYFEDLGVADGNSEECLDQYWVPEPHCHGRGTESPKVSKSHVCSLIHSPISSRSSSAASNSDGANQRTHRRKEKQPLPTSGTATRQRVKLRRLLRSSRSIL